jgi:CDP-diacylglycerol--glycerol-3-phosphate 3-phosphatidyltransferase
LSEGSVWQAYRVPVDPNAIATWANAVTVGRILVSPLMFVVIPDYPGGSWVAFVLWFVLCSSDGIDGYLARRHGATRSGAFLDPLADKVLVLGAMFTLVSRDVYWALPVLLIAAREVAISMYRVMVGAKGISVPASRLAKWKTLFQQLSVGFAIIPLTADKATWVWLWLLWIAVAFTTVSGLQYLWRAQKLRKTTPNLMA